MRRIYIAEAAFMLTFVLLCVVALYVGFSNGRRCARAGGTLVRAYTLSGYACITTRPALP